MKIKKQNIYITMLYTMVTAYMLGPMLSYKMGIPRIDNPLTLLLTPVTLLIFFIENKTFNSKVGLMLVAVGLMTGWSAIHLLITPMDSVRVMDSFFFLSVAGLFYLLYLILSRHENPLRFIRRLLIFFCAFIIIPPVIEVLTANTTETQVNQFLCHLLRLTALSKPSDEGGIIALGLR